MYRCFTALGNVRIQPADRYHDNSFVDNGVVLSYLGAVAGSYYTGTRNSLTLHFYCCRQLCTDMVRHSFLRFKFSKIRHSVKEKSAFHLVLSTRKSSTKCDEWNLQGELMLLHHNNHLYILSPRTSAHWPQNPSQPRRVISSHAGAEHLCFRGVFKVRVFGPNIAVTRPLMLVWYISGLKLKLAFKALPHIPEW